MTKSILIVDDDQDIAEGAAIRLRSAGYDIVFAHDGHDGCERAKRDRPNAIVLDIRMPKMDGIAVLGNLKNSDDTKSIPVVMMSASVVDEQVALDAGAKYFVRKPFHGQSLVEAVNSATDSIRE